ncbi:MAG: BLUF domain-containing protein [Amaricoccus sp.]
MRGQADLQELIEFAFESRAADGVPLAALLRMAAECRRYNIQSSLTGELRLSGESFRYVAEGSCQTLLPLVARILADPRHGSIRITAFGRIGQRRFDSWTNIGFDDRLDAHEPSAADVRVLALHRPIAPRQPVAVAIAR